MDDTLDQVIDTIDSTMDDLCEKLESKGRVWCEEDNTTVLLRHFNKTAQMLQSAQPFGVMQHLQECADRYKYYMTHQLFSRSELQLDRLIIAFLDNESRVSLLHQLCVSHYIDSTIMAYIGLDGDTR